MRARTISFPSWVWIAAVILALTTSCYYPPPPRPAPRVVTVPPAKQKSTTVTTTTTQPAPAPKAAPATPAPTASATPAGKTFTESDLAALLAPIALYPDTVIAQILMASTYPIEVIEAYRWLEKNKALKPEQLAAEVEKQTWDKSVKSLVVAPEVLKMLDDNLAWMQKLGDAVLAQQKEVFAMVQTLRTKAMAEGNLKSDDHMKVTSRAAAPAEEAATTTTTTTTTTEEQTQVIVIESANPEVVYVPTYDPYSMYGYWGYGYPPYYWGAPVGYPGSGFWWGVGAGIAIGGIWGNCCWGGGDVDIDWNGGDINIGGGDRGNIGDGSRGDRVEARRGEGGRTGDRAGATNRSGTGGKWSHNPEHRKGVSYRDNATASKFDRGSTGASSRESFRGRTGEGAGSRPSAGTRDRASGSGSRPSAGTRDTGSRSSGSRGSGSSYSGRSSSRSGGSAFGGMSGGSRAGSYGSRGGMSRGGGGGMRGGGGGRRR